MPWRNAFDSSAACNEAKRLLEGILIITSVFCGGSLLCR